MGYIPFLMRSLKNGLPPSKPFTRKEIALLIVAAILGVAGLIIAVVEGFSVPPSEVGVGIGIGIFAVGVIIAMVVLGATYLETIVFENRI